MVETCRFCHRSLEQFLDLGMSPLANSFLRKEDLESKEPIYPLRVFVCSNCFLVQLEEFEQPENIFKNYAYFSSYSDTWLEHSRKYVEMITNRFGFDSNSLIVEIASNDGYLLQYFKQKGIPILGIEPASNIAMVATKRGIPTMCEFFGEGLANKLADKGKQADLIIGNNVLAHVPALNDFVKGLKCLLKPNGIITLEFPHLLEIIRQKQFDTIYHEHFSYFSLYAVQNLFSYHGLTVFDVEMISTHGGSLRIFLRHAENKILSVKKSVSDLLHEEKKSGLTDIAIYKGFQSEVEDLRRQIRDFFITAKREEKKIVCYGAPAKGNTLLNYCKIGPDLVDFVVDRSPYKQGLFLPGTHIPIKAPKMIDQIKPEYLVIMPWNLKEEIISQMAHIREWQGRFVVLVPQVKIF